MYKVSLDYLTDFNPRHPRGRRPLNITAWSTNFYFNPHHSRERRIYSYVFQPRAAHGERRMAMERTIPKSTTHFNPRRLYGRRHIRKIERRARTNRFEALFLSPAIPSGANAEGCLLATRGHPFQPTPPFERRLSGIPMIWERLFHPRSLACRHQAGSLPISNSCFNPHGPFGR